MSFSSARSTLVNSSAIVARVSDQPLLHVVLHQPEIPQNTGNIGRTCVAVGAKLWLVRPLGFRIDDRNLARSGLDYWQHLEWEALDSWDDVRATHDESRMWYFTKTADRVYTSANFQPGDALVFGSETGGLPASILDAAGDRALRMPMRDQVRSLNLANSVAVACYEALRQFEKSDGS